MAVVVAPGVEALFEQRSDPRGSASDRRFEFREPARKVAPGCFDARHIVAVDRFEEEGMRENARVVIHGGPGVFVRFERASVDARELAAPGAGHRTSPPGATGGFPRAA